jgi:arylsulfatase A-like enzyme
VKFSRRDILTGAPSALLGAAAAAQPLVPPERLPNILWLVSEDNNPFIGSYGDRIAHTPNLDALARRGVLYRKAYSNYPVCAPSRFAILTGINPESCAPAQHMRATAHLPRIFRTYPELMRQAGYFCINNPKTDYNCDVDPQAIWDIQGPEGHWRRAPRDKPFLCVLNTGLSHEQQLCEPADGPVTPADVHVPAYLPDTPEVRQDYATYYNMIGQMDAQIGTWLAELEADGLTDNTIIFYYGDNGGSLPRSKRYCYEEGHRVGLIVLVPARWRHLSPGAPGSVIESPVTLLDLPATLLSIAGIAQPAQMNGKPLFGGRIAPPQALAFGGRDRMDERYDLIRTVSDGRWRYIRNYMPHLPWGQNIGGEWRVMASYREWEARHLAGTLNEVQDRFFRAKPYEELYDLAADPDQVHNLIGHSASRVVASRLSRALDRHMLAINDNGFLPEGAAGEGYFESRNRSVYPLRQLMTVASGAARRQPQNVRRFEALLASPVPAMRYWAAMGLLMLRSAAAPALPALRQAARSDAVPQVRVAAAEALIAAGPPDDAVSILSQLAGEPHPLPVRLQALNALSRIGRAALPALPVIRENARPVTGYDYRSYLSRVAQHLESVLSGTYSPNNEAMSPEACRGLKRSGRAFMG